MLVLLPYSSFSIKKYVGVRCTVQWLNQWQLIEFIKALLLCIFHKACHHRTSLRSLCVLVPLMGVSWVLGIFYVSEDLFFIQYIFAICNGLQVQSKTISSTLTRFKLLGALYLTSVTVAGRTMRLFREISGNQNHSGYTRPMVVKLITWLNNYTGYVAGPCPTKIHIIKLKHGGI